MEILITYAIIVGLIGLQLLLIVILFTCACPGIHGEKQQRWNHRLIVRRHKKEAGPRQPLPET